MVQVTINSKNGLHARPASLIVNAATKYKGEISLVKGESQINAKSIMNIMAMGLSEGETIKIVANGDGAADIERKLKAIIEGVEA